jgi:hypothetical protein
MKIFVSYSFRPENSWVEEYVIPLIRCFGHDVLTGQILGGGPLPDEVQKRIKASRAMFCFVTRGEPRNVQDGKTLSWHPPDWVRDELIIGRARGTETIEFREDGVDYGGAAPFAAWHGFSRDALPHLLLRLAELLKDWPVLPLQLHLAIPPDLQPAIATAIKNDTLLVKCETLDSFEVDTSVENLKVRAVEGKFIIPFWVKPRPSLAVTVEIKSGPHRLVSEGVSPAVCTIPLSPVN